MRQLITRTRPALGWAVCALAALFGAAINTGLYAGLMGGFTVIMSIASNRNYQIIRAARRTVERITDDQRALINMGRRARWILLTVKDKEGKLYAASLAQILTDTTPEGRDMLWDNPEGAALFYMDPGGIYVEAEHGDAA